MKKFAVCVLGGAALAVASPFAMADPPNGTCPQGWAPQAALAPDDPYDKNNDGIICTKPVQGQGNSGGNPHGTAVGHLPGHVHKDNTNPPNAHSHP